RRKMMRTLIEEGIIPGEEGVAKLNRKMGEAQAQRDALISAADDAGVRIDADQPIQKLDELIENVGGYKPNAKQNLEAIDGYIDNFIADHGKGRVTVKEVQDFKSSIYDYINWKQQYQQGTKIDQDILKNVGRAAKEAVEEAAPGVEEINRKWGAMLDVEAPLERSSARIDNRNAIGIQAPIVVTAAETVAPGIGGAAGTLGAMLSTPKNSARIALAADAIAKANGRVADVPRKILDGLTYGQVQQAMVLAGRNEQLQNQQP
ncbi:MAG: hypothetical protein KAS38_18735, partial [Anaerolineales bacterium]|nr:hypothetical protein [Anaerolineales bacterium]